MRGKAAADGESLMVHQKVSTELVGTFLFSSRPFFAGGVPPKRRQFAPHSSTNCLLPPQKNAGYGIAIPQYKMIKLHIYNKSLLNCKESLCPIL